MANASTAESDSKTMVEKSHDSSVTPSFYDLSLLFLTLSPHPTSLKNCFPSRVIPCSVSSIHSLGDLFLSQYFKVSVRCSRLRQSLYAASTPVTRHHPTLTHQSQAATQPTPPGASLQEAGTNNDQSQKAALWVGHVTRPLLREGNSGCGPLYQDMKL